MKKIFVVMFILWGCGEGYRFKSKIKALEDAELLNVEEADGNIEEVEIQKEKLMLAVEEGNVEQVALFLKESGYGIDVLIKARDKAFDKIDLRISYIIQKEIDIFESQTLKKIYEMKEEDKLAYGISEILTNEYIYKTMPQQIIIGEHKYEGDSKKELIDAYIISSTYEEYRKSLTKSMEEYEGGNILHVWADVSIQENREREMDLLDIILRGDILSEKELKKAINFKNKKGVTPLHKGVVNLNVELVNKLIIKGASRVLSKEVLTEFKFRTSYHYRRNIEDYLGVWSLVEKIGDEAERLESIKGELDINDLKDIGLLEGLHICRIVDNKKMFKRIYEKNIENMGQMELNGVAQECALAGWNDIFRDLFSRSKGREKYYARMAAYLGEMEIFEGIVKKEKMEEEGFINNALVGGNLYLVERILKKRSKVFNKLFFKAISIGHYLLVKIMLRDERYLNLLSSYDADYSINQAACKKKFKIINLILEKMEIKVCSNHYFWEQVLNHLALSKKWGAVELVFNKVQNINWSCYHDSKERVIVLNEALKDGQVEVVKMVLDRGLGINYSDDGGKNLLDYAVEGGHLEVVELLISRRAKVRESSKSLILAVERGYLEIVRSLLNAGANPNVKYCTNTPLMVAAKFGHTRIVALLLEQNGITINSRFNSPLMYAAENGHIEIVDLLLTNEANTDGALASAAKGGHLEVVNFLISRRVETESSDRWSKEALIYAVQGGNVEILRIFLGKFQDHIDAVDLYDKSALAYAVENGRIDMVQLLISAGATVGGSLRYAAGKGHMEIVEFLMSKRANTSDAMYLAARGGHCEIVKFLIDNGAEIEVNSSKYTTVLISAVESGKVEMVKLLISSGLKLENEQSLGLLSALKSNHSAMAELILKNCGDTIPANELQEEKLNHYDFPALILAIKTKNPVVVELLVNKGANVNFEIDKTRNKKSPLIYAIKLGQKEIVEILLKNGADVNYWSEIEESYSNILELTPLMYALKIGYLGIAELLLENGAKVNEEDKRGKSALMYAIEEGKNKTLELLLEKGENIVVKERALALAVERGNKKVLKLLLSKQKNENEEDENQKAYSPYSHLYKSEQTALIAAISKGDMEIVELLLDNGVNVEAQNQDGVTALMYAASKGNITAVKLLLKANAKIDAKDKSGYTALVYSFDAKDIKISRLLLELGAAEDEGGAKALIYAALEGKEKLADMILKKGVEVNVSNEIGMTALMCAAENGKKEVLKLLLNKGADVNARDDDGYSVIMYAVRCRYLGTMSLLLSKNPDLSVKNKMKMTALQMAEQYGNTRAIGMIKQAFNKQKQYRKKGNQNRNRR